MVAQTAKAAMNVASNVRHAISVISNIGFLPSDLAELHRIRRKRCDGAHKSRILSALLALDLGG